MSDAKPLWADLSTDEQDEELIEALVSGKSVYSLAVRFDGLKYRELTRRMNSLEFRDKSAPALDDAVGASRLAAAFLAASTLLSGVAVKDGLATKELKLLLDRQKDIQGGTPATTASDEMTCLAIDTIEKQLWKLKNLTPEA